MASAFGRSCHVKTPPQLLCETQSKSKNPPLGVKDSSLKVKPTKSQTLQYPSQKIWLQHPGKDKNRRQMQKCHLKDTAWRPPCSMGCFQHAHQKVAHSRAAGWSQHPPPISVSLSSLVSFPCASKCVGKSLFSRPSLTRRACRGPHTLLLAFSGASIMNVMKTTALPQPFLPSPPCQGPKCSDSSTM